MSSSHFPTVAAVTKIIFRRVFGKDWGKLGASQVAHWVKNPPVIQETQGLWV